MKCWWIFGHKYGKWVDANSGLILWQRKRCEKCGKARERAV